MSVSRQTESGSSDRPNSYDAVIIGAGFSGLYLLDRLREDGFSVRILEAGSGIGGIWHWNCYPGARVDSTVAAYQYTRDEIWREWDWSERFPDYEEMRAYFDFVDKKRDLSRDIEFSTRVSAAKFDENACQWEITALGEDSEEKKCFAKFLLPCTGFAAKEYIPDIPGLGSFSGICHHTGLWPQSGVDFTDKRVGVLGTGASGVQVAQEAARTASQLTVFQRTPNLCLPMQQQQLDRAANVRLRETYPESFAIRNQSFGGTDFLFTPKSALQVSPEERNAKYEELWATGGFWFWLANYEDVLIDEQANRTAYNFWRDKVRARINDPAIAEMLAPTEPPHPFGTKRPSLEQWYYDIFNEEHVALVDVKSTPIERVTQTSVITSDSEYELDILALATGFDAVTGGLTNIEIRGIDGNTLKEKWTHGVRTYQGIANAGFPNLLVSYGPQAPTGFCNGPTSAEIQGDYIADCLNYMRERGLTRIETTPEAEEAWRADCLKLVEPTLFPRADSWYMGANVPGKPREILMYPGGVPLYLEELQRCVDNGYSGYVLS
ncbi:MAG: NAD(P)/FAD-dependent oxidoreductase [Pseudomonadota bacterium]